MGRRINCKGLSEEVYSLAGPWVATDRLLRCLHEDESQALSSKSGDTATR